MTSDGRLDIYFCMYMYYLGLDQYHYPIPYYDARNGPPNCLFHNEGDGTFVETTEAAGLNADNDRYSFACAWGDSNSTDCQISSSPTISAVRNSIATMATGPSRLFIERSARRKRWRRHELLLGRLSTTTAARTSMCPACGRPPGSGSQNRSNFIQTRRKAFASSISAMRAATPSIATRATAPLTNAGHEAKVEMGRWSWSSDFWDFDHDGYADLYVANGYLSETGIE